MSFEKLLNHKCAIYHMIKNEKNLGYGIKAGDFCYPEEPDIPEIACHFNVRDTGSMEQTENANEYLMTGKLNLPAGTDVRVNDKIVDLENGLEYRAEIPRNIRDHHMIVTIQRKGTVKGAM